MCLRRNHVLTSALIAPRLAKVTFSAGKSFLKASTVHIKRLFTLYLSVVRACACFCDCVALPYVLSSEATTEAPLGALFSKAPSPDSVEDSKL